MRRRDDRSACRIAVVMRSATSNHTAAGEYVGSLRNNNRAILPFILKAHSSGAPLNFNKYEFFFS